MEWKVCLENTESHILFEQIKLIKQFAEKRREDGGEKMLDDKIYSRVEITRSVATERQRLCFLDLTEFFEFA